MRRILLANAVIAAALAAGATLGASAGCCVPSVGSAPRSTTRGLFASRALPAVPIARATRDFRDRLAASPGAAQQVAPRGVRELAASLRDSDPAVRAQAACSLRELGDRAADTIPALVALMDDATPLKADVC